ncbi:MAG: hypothetical protein ABIJ16_08635 [Bacteroidota bacterium]
MQTNMSYIKYSPLIICTLAILFVFSSCKTEDEDFIIDVSHIDPALTTYHFDRDLFTLDPDCLYTTVPEFAMEYGEFFDLFTHRVINIGGMENMAFPDHLKIFLTDKLNIEVYEYTSGIFSDMSLVETELTDAFRYYRYYFPEKTVPSVYYYISRFNQSVVTSDSILGIGLDNYLGPSCDYYYSLGLPSYMRYRMRKEMIVVDAMSGWAMTEFPMEDGDENLLRHMLYNAKVQYFLCRVVPEKHDSLRWGYSGRQLDWCKENEKDLWVFAVENKLLFSTDFMDIKRYTEEGPCTITISRDAPSRAMVWLGLQIIKAYMKNNPEISFQDLMEEDDYQKILNKSKYNP